MKNKVKLPKDRTGIPANIGDVLQWDDGTVMRVEVLSYYGDGMWAAETLDDDFTDNIEGAKVIRRKKQ